MRRLIFKINTCRNTTAFMSKRALHGDSSAAMCTAFPTIQTFDVPLWKDTTTIVASSILLRLPVPSQHSFLNENTRGRQLAHAPKSPSAVSKTNARIEESLDAIILASEYVVARDETCTEEVLFGTRRCVSSRGVVNERQLGSFVGGRIALRRALRQNAVRNGLAQEVFTGLDSAILSEANGAPLMPASMTGTFGGISISHKDSLALAAAVQAHSTSASRKTRLGCDIEKAHASPTAAAMLGKRILSAQELSQLGTLRVRCSDDATTGKQDLIAISKEEETMLLFSFKESAFKALNGILHRQIDFEEVVVRPTSDGQADIRVSLRTAEDANVSGDRPHARNSAEAHREPLQTGLGPAYEQALDLQCSAQWRRYVDDGKTAYWLTWVSVSFQSQPA